MAGLLFLCVNLREVTSALESYGPHTADEAIGGGDLILGQCLFSLFSVRGVVNWLDRLGVISLAII